MTSSEEVAELYSTILCPVGLSLPGELRPTLPLTIHHTSFPDIDQLTTISSHNLIENIHPFQQVCSVSCRRWKVDGILRIRVTENHLQRTYKLVGTGVKSN